MNLADVRLEQLDATGLNPADSVLSRCAAAADLIETGRHEAAREALGGLWRGIGETPEVVGLGPEAAAEVLLRCGALTGWLGSLRSVEGSQERAKDMLSESLREFQSQGRQKKVSEAQYELAICYWRLGAYDEARVVTEEALKPLADADIELKAKILIRRTLVEVSENRYYDALSILKEAEPVFELAGDAMKGRWHGQKGLVLRRLASAEGQADYFDRAIIEYTAAIYHYEQAEHERYCATNLNNLAFLLYKLGRYGEAHENLDRAQLMLARLKDEGLLAQVQETRARVFVAERKYAEAGRIIAGVVRTLEKGGEAGLLADALTVQGLVWARVGDDEGSVGVLRRAAEVAQSSGALSNAGLASLTLIEEHGARRLPEQELLGLYLRADELLRGSQDAEDAARLRACARLVVKRLSGAQLRDSDFSLHDAVHDLEARLIARALEEARGSVSRAARLLGLEHQPLIYLLNTRHKHLAAKRTPAKPRLRSIIKKSP